MIKHYSAAILAFSLLATPIASQATLIQLLHDDLQMYTQVYSTGNPGTITSESSYTGSLFEYGDDTISSISSVGNVACDDPSGINDHQWAKARASASISDPYFEVKSSSGWGNICNTANAWTNLARIQAVLEFEVIPEGPNYVFIYIEEFDTSFSLIDKTLGIDVSPDLSGTSYFHLLDNHTYLLNVDVTRVASQDSLPYGYNEEYAFMYYPYFNAVFANARISPVSEPDNLVLFGLSIVCLLLVRLVTQGASPVG